MQHIITDMVDKMVKKRYFCQARIRRVIYSEDYISALKEFSKAMEDNELSPTVKLKPKNKIKK